MLPLAGGPDHRIGPVRSREAGAKQADGAVPRAEADAEVRHRQAGPGAAREGREGGDGPPGPPLYHQADHHLPRRAPRVHAHGRVPGRGALQPAQRVPARPLQQQHGPFLRRAGEATNCNRASTTTWPISTPRG
eukprot:1192719-Prorocentrum_minimum.AAC.1